MKRIIIHWTAGKHEPNSTDYEHYHFLINGNGLCINGKYKPEDNLDCSDGKYAAHTGGGNTGSIGIAACGMLGYINPRRIGAYPLTARQTEALFKKVAELCKKYELEITPDTVMTHYEFGQKYPKTSSYGKIDITYLPSYPNVNIGSIGNFIRNKISWYYKRLP